MGLTFEENCPDVRNSKVVDVIRELKKYGARVDAYDPWVNPRDVKHEYGITPVKTLTCGRALAKRRHALFDIKYLFKAEMDGRL